MRLLPKWFIIFVITGVYVTFLAGWFYKNLFTWFFHEKLKQELVALLYVNQSKFVSGLLNSPKIVTIEEVDSMKGFLNDKRIVYAFIVSKSGYIRWAADPQLFGKHIREFEQIHPLPTLGVARAMATKSPRVESFRRDAKDYYEITFPFVHQGDIKAVASLEVSLEETKATIAQGMKKFYTGAVGVVILFLLTGIGFLYVFVIGPIRDMRDTVDNLALAQPVWPEAKIRRDELGNLQKSLAVFFEKLKSTVSRYERDRKDLVELEKQRWQHILKIFVRSGGALILDGDNYVLAEHNMEQLLSQQTQKAVNTSRKVPVLPHPLTGGGVPEGSMKGSPHPHLLDFVTSTDLLQLINHALEKPGNFVESSVLLEAVAHSARVMTLMGAQPQDQRTIVWLDPQTKTKTV